MGEEPRPCHLAPRGLSHDTHLFLGRVLEDILGEQFGGKIRKARKILLEKYVFLRCDLVNSHPVLVNY
jgi:hypothetical protein